MACKLKMLTKDLKAWNEHVWQCGLPRELLEEFQGWEGLQEMRVLFELERGRKAHRIADLERVSLMGEIL